MQNSIRRTLSLTSNAQYRLPCVNVLVRLNQRAKQWRLKYHKPLLICSFSRSVYTLNAYRKTRIYEQVFIDFFSLHFFEWKYEMIAFFCFKSIKYACFRIWFSLLMNKQIFCLKRKLSKTKIKHASIQPNIYPKSTKFNMAAKSDIDV